MRANPPVPTAAWRVALVAATFAIYSVSLLNEFVWDDLDLVVWDPVVRNEAPISSYWTEPLQRKGWALSFWRPLPSTVYAVTERVVGFEAFAYHLVSIAAHAGVVLMLFEWLRRMGIRDPVAAAASALYAAHPYLTPAVTYVSGLADPLAAFFGLGALILWSEGGRKTFLGCAAWTVALFCKEWALLLPVLAIWTLRRDPGFRASRDRWLATCAAIAAVYFSARYVVFKGYPVFHSVPMGWKERIACAIGSLAFYLGGGFLPFRLRMDRLYPLDSAEFWTWAALGVLIGWLLIRGILRLRRECPRALPGIAWFALFWILHSNLLRPLNAHFAEHWMYFAYAGLAWSAAEVWQAKRPASRVWILALAAIGIFWAAQNIAWQRKWRDEITLFESNIAAGADAARTHAALGFAYGKKGNYPKASEQFEQALERDPFYYRGLWGLARCEYRFGHYARAVAIARIAARVFPEERGDLDPFIRTCLEKRAGRKPATQKRS
ncbi:MAG: tetratricopeptide repeat protein [Verrucomicrobiae bacterium]|nr:tetratricopeptide repeat protein [Verrucomicrobiae bacterium]